MRITTLFNVGDKVTSFDEDSFFASDFGIIKEIHIEISAIGPHVRYEVADVDSARGVISTTFHLDECNLSLYEEAEEEKIPACNEWPDTINRGGS